VSFFIVPTTVPEMISIWYRDSSPVHLWKRLGPAPHRESWWNDPEVGAPLACRREIKPAKIK